MKWQTYRLGDVITLKRGHDLPEAQRQDGEVPVVSSSGITGYHNEPKAKAPGVVTGRYGTLGEVFYIEQDYWPLNTALYVIDFKGNHPRFVAYLLQNILRNYQSDKAAVPGVNRNVLHDLQVRSTDLMSQEKIADILSPYDDLIENNRRRMALLEEAARQLYREWFVRLRFPGHEHARITNGVPEWWEKTNASRAMSILSGGTPKTSVPDFWDGDIPFYTPKDASDHCYVLETERSVTELGLHNCNSRLYAKDTIFISARGTVGKLNLAYQPMAMSQSCYALVGKGYVSQFFLYCALQQSIEYLKQHAVGAVFNAIVVDTFKLIPFLLPDVRNVQLFEETVTPILDQVGNLMRQNQKLRAARDLLLPRLMSGEIVV
jgi:type I restriction enzyme S subunit